MQVINNGVAGQQVYKLPGDAGASVTVGEPASVAVLLCTYQGGPFLAQQLASLAGQTHTRWRVWASDDGSTDATLGVLEQHQAQWGAGRLHIVNGPRQGAAANFLALACCPDINATYYAFSDQDDIWEPEKLERALRWLDTVPAGTPALYCSRTRVTNADGTHVALSPLFAKPPTFPNALVQSLAGGNTMVFNQPARQLLLEAGTPRVVMHDWWLYLVVTGCGGMVHYDPWPSVRYRQHDANVVGIGNTWAARFDRIRWLLAGRFRGWTDINLEALNTLRHRLTTTSLHRLQHFEAARTSSLPARLWHMRKSGIYRQTLPGNLGLFLSILANKI